jgi:hypothetical protein
MMEFKKPKVGDGGTMCVGSDRYPFTIWKVSASGKTIWVTEDDGNKKDGFIPRPPRDGYYGKGARVRFVSNRPYYYKNHCYYHIGDKDFYWDPSF